MGTTSGTSVFVSGVSTRLCSFEVTWDRESAHVDGLPGQPVRQPGIDAHQARPGAHQFPGVPEAAPGIIALRNPGLRPFVHACAQGARVGGVGRDFLARIQADIGEKTLVAAQENASEEGSRKFHY